MIRCIGKILCEGGISSGAMVRDGKRDVDGVNTRDACNPKKEGTPQASRKAWRGSQHPEAAENLRRKGRRLTDPVVGAEFRIGMALAQRTIEQTPQELARRQACGMRGVFESCHLPARDQ